MHKKGKRVRGPLVTIKMMDIPFVLGELLNFLIILTYSNRLFIGCVKL